MTATKSAALIVALLACMSGCQKQTPAPTGPAPVSQATQPLAEDARPLAERPPSVVAKPSAESCLDAWLEARNLDRFGHPEGTMYAGGTPLFDERTGTATDRLTYVLGRHPEAKAACAPDAGPVNPGGLPTE